jgi:hypothetical protein
MEVTMTFTKDELDIITTLLGGIRISVTLANADADRYTAARGIVKKIQAAQATFEEPTGPEPDRKL